MKSWYTRKPERFLAEQFNEKDLEKWGNIVKSDEIDEGIYFLANKSSILLFDGDWITFNPETEEANGVIRNGYFQTNYMKEEEE